MEKFRYPPLRKVGDVDVEMVDLELTPDRMLEKITAGIAGLCLDEVDKLAERLADLTLDDGWSGGLTDAGSCFGLK